jgi:DNA-binding response OmpR family regulator
VEYVRTHAVDLMVVDFRMPGMDGLEVIRVVNQTSPDTEVILLTAYGSTETAIQALRLRVHDYLLKPALPTQIIASVKKGLVRRDARTKGRGGPGLAPSDEPISEFRLKDGTIADLSRRLIRKNKKVAHLTPAEGRLLRVLLENPGKVFSHRDLVLLVQGYDTSLQEAPEVLRPLVSRLRHKLEDFPDLMNRISSVRGTGYVYEANEN